MISFPPFERHFNQPPGTKVAGALSHELMQPLAETAAQRTGLYHARYDDVATLMLMVGPRLQNYASEGVEYSIVVEDVRAKLGL